MANLDLATLSVQIRADGNQARQEMASVGEASKQEAKKVESSWKKTGEALTSIGKTLSLSISAPLTAAGVACVKLASDLTETLGKTEVVFGNLSDTVIAWSETSVESMGLAQETALNMASTYGDLGTAMGLSVDEAANMSMSLVQLGADMASFKNISIERANVALQAIYTGETESLKAMGIVMTEANLEQFAMAQGCEKTYKSMSQTEKVMLRYKYVMSMTTNAQGDFVRTGDSLANQSRKLGENIKQLGASFGKILEPTITSVISTINWLVSWISGLDDGVKRVIITVAEIVAAVPVIITAIGGVITVVDKLKVAFTALTANPVAAWITAITVAIAALVAIITTVKGAIDEYNASIAELKDKEITVKTNYETLIKVSQDKNQSIDDVINDIDAAIAAAQSAGELVAKIATVEDKDRSVDSVIASIDSALKAKELECQIAGKKKENDATWQELNALRAGILNGTITIYGEDGNGTLAKLGTAINQVDSDLAALKAYEDNVIKPRIEFETQTAQEHADALYEKCGEIAGIDTNIEFAFSVSNLGSAEGGDGVMGALFQAIATADEWTADLTNVQEAFDNLIEKQKTFIISMSASQMYTAWAAYEQGKITLDELYSSWDASIAQCQAFTEKLDAESDTAGVLQDKLKNGLTADDKPAVLDFLESTVELNPELTNTKTYAEQVATASGRINEAMAAGADSTDAMRGDIVELNSGLNGLGDDMENKITSAYDKYSGSVDEANKKQEESLTAIDKNKAKQEEEITALQTYATYLQTHRENASLAVQAMSEECPEILEKVVAFYGSTDELMEQNVRGILSARDGLLLEMNDKETGYQAQRQAIIEEGNQARLDAETQLGEDLSSIKSEFDIQALFAIKEQCEAIGNQEGIAAADRLLGMEGYCRTAEDLTEQNGFNIVALNRQTLGEVVGLTPTAKDAGESVGSNLGEGMYEGIDGWTKRIADKARQAIKNAVAAARQEADIHSPSRKTRDLIGKPFAQGIEEGIEDYTPNLLRSTRNSMNAIITAGTGTVNSNYKLQPANTTNVAHTTINQTNNFTSRTLSPYEQQTQIKRLNKDLAGVFA